MGVHESGAVSPRRMRGSMLGRVALVFLLACSGVVTAAIEAPRPADAAMNDIPAAVLSGVNNAASVGVTQYVVVLDRGTGHTVASTANANSQVASESVMKLFIAAYYLRAYGGNLPAPMSNELWKMITQSDDGTASRYWRADIIPTIAAAYGMPNTANDPTRPGYWGAARITAADMATFLRAADHDPAVRPWLYNAMSATTDFGSDGFNQNFGMNTIPGAASKQGWGCDSYWVGPCAIHSVGATSEVIAVVLQTGAQGTYGSQRATATHTAQAVVSAARTIPPATVHVANSYHSGSAEAVFSVTPSGTQYAACDWDGNGTQTLASFVNGAWRLYDDNYVFGPVAVLGYGSAGDIPVCGRWAGSGVETIGVYRPADATFYLRTSNSSGVADLVVPLGNHGDQPLVGDWDGDGVWTVGVYRKSNATFYLASANLVGAAAAAHFFGNHGDMPLVGRFGNGAAFGLGVRRGSLVHLAPVAGGPVTTLFGYGDPLDRFLMADWNGDLLYTQAVIR